MPRIIMVAPEVLQYGVAGRLAMCNVLQTVNLALVLIRCRGGAERLADRRLRFFVGSFGCSSSSSIALRCFGETALP